MITLPETNIAPENWWLEDDPFLLGRPICTCELLVLGSVRIVFLPHLELSLPTPSAKNAPFFFFRFLVCPPGFSVR